MKIYTKTGDDGSTGLFNGVRVSKADLRVEAYGTVDELNSIIGLAVAFDMPERLKPIFTDISHTLFNLGSDLATPLNPKPKFEVPRITGEKIQVLENAIDEYDLELEPLRNFILPGGSRCSAFLHQARTVCRRAERRCVELSMTEDLGLFVVKYLNRLSDFLFAASRMANHLAGVQDVKWKA